MTIRLLDAQWLAYFEREPLRASAFMKQRLAALINYATENSAWWRERLEGVLGQGATFADVPILDRASFRASIEHAGGPLPLPQVHGRAHKYSTSGSSGVPVEFYLTNMSKRMGLCHEFYDGIRQGRDLSRVMALVINSVPKHEGPHVVKRRHVALGGGVILERKTQQFSIEEHARWLAEIKPAYFRTAPSVLSGILDVYESGAVEPPRSIEQVPTVGETVTLELRQRVRSVLGASIRDRYGSEEAGILAFQCPHSDEHYHVATTNAFVEVLDESGRACRPGVVGRVIVTGLHNYANPVIRYELGDLAAWQPGCTCGHAGPVLTDLLGRKRFLVRLPSGERKAVHITARLWLPIAPFRETRLVQVSEGVLHAEVVLDRPLTDQEREAVLAMLREVISPDLTYEVHQVEAIAWAPTYKRQDVVSLI